MPNLISVIIPVFNRASHILDAVDTVFAQNMNLELILVDDASKDDSAKIILDLASKDKRIIPIIFKQNQGGGAARNAGIKKATGEWIAFLDSDDLWMPEKLSKQVEALRSYSQENTLCFTNLVVDYHDGLTALPWNSVMFDNCASAKNYILNENQFIQTSTILVSAKVAKCILFNDNLRRHQDFDFVLRCEKAGVNFVYLPECLVKYSADPNINRVSRRVNATPSLHWLEVAKDYLTTSEIDAFYLKHVLDIHYKDNPFKAFKHTLRIANNHNLDIFSVIYKFAKLLLPETLKKMIKKSWYVNE